jgi:predicted nucleic acid-binding protein
LTDPPGRLLVIDSSALVALLGDVGPEGAWVADAIAGSPLAAPELALFEAADVFRRQALAGIVDQSHATLAHADLVALPLQLWPYSAVAERAWQLRENVTSYDASYIALAELLRTSLVTLDSRLARAPGARCPVLTYRASTA